MVRVKEIKKYNGRKFKKKYIWMKVMELRSRLLEIYIGIKADEGIKSLKWEGLKARESW